MTPALVVATPALAPAYGTGAASLRLPRLPRTRAARMGLLLVVVAAGLALWTVYLGLTLPVTATGIRWSDGHFVVTMGRAAWVSLDVLETLGLAATGVAVLRRYRGVSWIAMATVPLFVADMWLDAMSASSVGEVREAIVMATFGELPTTLLLIAVAAAVPFLWRRRVAKD